MKIILCILLILAINVGSVTAKSYKVTNVIEVGPAAKVLSSGSLRWSPDGTMLAYFVHNYLMVSDTLGNSRKIASIPDAYPMRAEWASNSEFAVSLRGERQPGDSIHYKLVVYNVNKGNEIDVDEFWRTRTSHLPGHTNYEGPFVTIEGTAYYEQTSITGKMNGTKEEIRRSRIFKDERLAITMDKRSNLEQNNLFHWLDDGLYEISMDSKDTNLIIQKPIGFSNPMFTDITLDKNFVVNRNLLINVSNDDVIDLNKLSITRSTGAKVCGFYLTSLNPVGDEVIGMYSCDDGHTILKEDSYIYNYTSGELITLDELINKDGCTLPIYAPDGARFAVRCQNIIYIVNRKIQP